MRRILLTILAALCLASPSFAAKGVNLRWDACLGAGGVSNKSFACNTNTGTDYLFASFTLDTAFTDITGCEVYIDITPLGGLPSPWWDFKNTGTCRRTAATASFLVSTTGCVNPFELEGQGGLTNYGDAGYYGYPNRYRLYAIAALPPTAAFTAEAHQEVFAMRIGISHALTVGAGSCSGCENPVCIGVSRIKLTRPVGMGPSLFAVEESAPGSSHVTWQQGVASSRIADYFYSPNGNWPYRDVACTAATPAQNRTWGLIKTLYR